MNSQVDLAAMRRMENAHAWRSVQYTLAKQGLHPEVPIRVEPIAGGYMIYAGDGSPLNSAVGLGCQGPVTPANLKTIERFYHGHNTLPKIDLFSLADPSLLDQLEQRGYWPESSFYMLACSLPGESLPMASSDPVTISQAGPEEAALWINTVAKGFSEKEIPDRETLDLLAPNFYSANATCFLAWIAGEPVGGGAMYGYEGVAEFGGASTRPGFRRQGVQTALLLARVQSAHAQGCDLAIVMTPQGSDSQRNVERVGFRLAYERAVFVKSGEDVVPSEQGE